MYGSCATFNGLGLMVCKARRLAGNGSGNNALILDNGTWDIVRGTGWGVLIGFCAPMLAMRRKEGGCTETMNVRRVLYCRLNSALTFFSSKSHASCLSMPTLSGCSPPIFETSKTNLKPLLTRNIHPSFCNRLPTPPSGVFFPTSIPLQLHHVHF